MNPVVIFLAGAVVLLLLGLVGIVLVQSHIKRVLAVNIASVGVFMLLISLSHRDMPYGLDPVPQGMVLTGIVVSVVFTALALKLIVLINTRQSTDNH